jgi:glycerol-3-phosphate dehydrogenase (NAD(P)+)
MEGIEITPDLAEAVHGAGVVVGVMPSAYARSIYRNLAPHLPPDCLAVSASKGLEASTLLRMTQVMEQELGHPSRIAALSGPTFAEEVTRGEPTAVVVAAQHPPAARRLQSLLATNRFRPYASFDPVGVECGGALKNVIAVAAGVIHGLGLGSNAHAALITRGLAEMTRLAVALGGEPRTLSGLAGLGDLVLTCGGTLSRNRRVGVELAAGRPIEEIVQNLGGVAEGVGATRIALELASRHSVELPIAAQMDRLLRAEITPQQAISALMERELRSE